LVLHYRKKVANGPKEKQTDYAGRSNRDAEIMRQKQQAAETKKQQQHTNKKADLSRPNDNRGSNVVTNQKAGPTPKMRLHRTM
jgi:nitrogen fixation protein FixH